MKKYIPLLPIVAFCVLIAYAQNDLTHVSTILPKGRQDGDVLKWINGYWQPGDDSTATVESGGIDAATATNIARYIASPYALTNSPNLYTPTIYGVTTVNGAMNFYDTIGSPSWNITYLGAATFPSIVTTAGTLDYLVIPNPSTWLRLADGTALMQYTNSTINIRGKFSANGYDTKFIGSSPYAFYNKGGFSTDGGNVSITGSGTFSGPGRDITDLTLGNIAGAGATVGQIPKWNGSAWVPSADNIGEFGGVSSIWGQTGDVTPTKLQIETSLGGTPIYAPLTLNKIDQSSATANQIVRWNGSAWAANTPNSTDIINWYGHTPLYAPITLSNIGQSSATTGQVPKWNGSAWVPAADSEAAPSDVNAITGYLDDVPANMTDSDRTYNIWSYTFTDNKIIGFDVNVMAMYNYSPPTSVETYERRTQGVIFKSPSYAVQTRYQWKDDTFIDNQIWCEFDVSGNSIILRAHVKYTPYATRWIVTGTYHPANMNTQ